MEENGGHFTYSKSGVDYSSIDPAKISAQSAAASTAKNLKNFGMNEVPASRGESAYVWKENEKYKALVVEGLGTKNLAADAYRKSAGKTFYDNLAQDTVAMIVNDLIVVGALPTVINAYFAIGDSNWMNDRERANDLINGWAKACDLAGAAWGGGETPALKGIINPDTIDLAGSAIGQVETRQPVLGKDLQEGDVIILIESSGIHSNGLTLARSLAEKATEGYNTKLSDGRTYGEALLTPTHIYVNFVDTLIKSGADIHYMVNITGHGWRKLMRANQEYAYEIDFTPPIPAEFEFIKNQAGIDGKEMYGNFNMGAGFAVYLPEKHSEKALQAASNAGFKAWKAGKVTKGNKKVVIKNLNITFEADSLGVR